MLKSKRKLNSDSGNNTRLKQNIYKTSRKTLIAMNHACMKYENEEA
jgi:hypothetical protein